MESSRFRAFALTLALAAAAPVPAADVLILQDGRILEGASMERGPEGVTVHFENGDVVVPSGEVRDLILEGREDAFEPRNEEERQKLERGFVPFEGRWVSPSKRDRMLEEKLEEHRARVEEMKETRLWRNRIKEETEFYEFEVTVPRHIFEYYRDLMETYTEEFFDMWRIRKPRDLPKLLVKFYVDYDAFLQVTGMSPGVLGFFRFVEPLELNIYYDRLDPRGTEEVIYHEVGHYLQKLMDVDFKMPHWPGESLCEYYSASEWDNEEKELTFDLLHEGRLAAIQLDIANGERVGLRDMLLGCQDRNPKDYSWGWSFVHFLMQDRKHKKNFQKFMVALSSARDIDRSRQMYGRYQLKTVSGEEMLRAFMKYMKIDDEAELAELEAEWHDYVQNDIQITSTRGLANAARRAVRNSRPIRAKSLYQKAVDQGAHEALTYHRYAELLAKDDELEEAYAMWEKAVELDPITPEFYIDWGRTLVENGDEEEKEEGKRLLRLAHEIEPDNFYLERNLTRLLAK